MRVLPVAGALLVALQAGCAGTQPAQPPPALPTAVLPQHTWEDPRVQASWQALGGETPITSIELTPTEAFAAALAFNPEMALLRAQVEIGHAGVLAARQRANPVLSLSPEKVINAALGVSPWIAAISLGWPVQTAGKRSLAIEQALATDDANLLGAANEIWMLRASVRKSLCAAELVNARLALAHEELALRDDMAGRLSKQASAGLVSEYEAVRARLERDRSAQSLLHREAEVMVSRRDLAAVTGLPVTEIDRRKLGDSCLAGRSSVRTGAMSEAALGAVTTRLDLQARLAAFRSADAAWRKEVAKRVPDLNLGPGYTYDQGAHKVTFTISGELPIFARNDAAIAGASAERSRAVADVEVLQHSVLDSVDRAQDRLRAAELLHDQAIETVARTQGLLGRDIERRNAGELDQPAVISSRLAVVVAQSDVLTARLELSDALDAFEAATQVPVVAPLFDGHAAQSFLASQGSTTGEASP